MSYNCGKLPVILFFLPVVIQLIAGCSNEIKTGNIHDSVAAIGSTSETIFVARYYECTLIPKTLNYKHTVGIKTEKLKFLVDSHLTIAFRNDVGPAHAVKLLVDVTGSLILVDHIPGKEISILVMEKNGQSVFSRHKLGYNQSDANESTQLYGKCYEMLDVA